MFGLSYLVWGFLCVDLRAHGLLWCGVTGHAAVSDIMA